jgi:hypothetical protein
MIWISVAFAILAVGAFWLAWEYRKLRDGWNRVAASWRRIGAAYRELRHELETQQRESS